jgi:phosphohistidine phosphatase
MGDSSAHDPCLALRAERMLPSSRSALTDRSSQAHPTTSGGWHAVPASWEDREIIWLLRHGDAEDSAGDDASRRLTGKGEGQALAAGRALAELGVEVDRCLTSPKVRAADTARIACEELGISYEETEALAGGDFDPHELAAGFDTVLLVGHEPDFSRAVQLTTGARIELKKGGLAAVDGSVLSALLRPPQIRRIAGV